MLAVGTIGILLSIYGMVFRGRSTVYLVVVMVFAGLMLGVGTFGPSFMGKYTGFLRIVAQMVTAPHSTTYQAAFDRIGTGDIDPVLQEITLSYALDRPIEDLDSLLAKAINGASSNDGRGALINARQELTRRIEEAKLLSNRLETEEIETLNPATRMLVSMELLADLPGQGPIRAPASDLRSIEPSEQLKQKLQQWSQPRPTMVPMRQ